MDHVKKGKLRLLLHIFVVCRPYIAGSNNNADSNKQGNATNNPLYAQSPMVVLEPIHLENAILKAVELGRTSGTSSSSCSAPGKLQCHMCHEHIRLFGETT